MSLQHDGRRVYRITVKGLLDKSWSAWFDGMEIVHLDGNCSLIMGPIRDQAALHGLLNRIRDLGLCLLSIEYTNPDC